MLGNPLDASKPKKAYARAQVTNAMSLDDFAAHISDHNNVYDKGDVYAVLSKAVGCLRELVLDGKKVCLGDLGSFTASLASKGAATADDFTAANIKRVTMVWEKGESLKDMQVDAKFEQVSSRAAQAAALKAQKEGKTTASWDTVAGSDTGSAVTPGTGTSGSGSGTGTSGSGTGTGSGSDSGTGSGSGSGTGSGEGNV
jgi:predicted histone-like DNA-binding protein